MSHFDPPTTGTPLEMGNDGKLVVPNDPVSPFIEGDGIGRDIWKAHDFHRLPEGATKIECSEFGDEIIENMS